MMTDDSLLLNEEVQTTTHWVDVLYFPDLVAELRDLDGRLRPLLTALSDRAEDPDLLLEDIAELVGDGLHRCQRYIRRRVGFDSGQAQALRCGPQLGTRYLAEVIWAGANYWKHEAEWPLEEWKLTDRQKATLCVFRDAGVIEDEYWLAHILYVLTPEHVALSPLVHQLVLWRSAFDNQIERNRRQPRRRRRARRQLASSGQ